MGCCSKFTVLSQTHIHCDVEPFNDTPSASILLCALTFEHSDRLIQFCDFFLYSQSFRGWAYVTVEAKVYFTPLYVSLGKELQAAGQSFYSHSLNYMTGWLHTISFTTKLQEDYCVCVCVVNHLHACFVGIAVFKKWMALTFPDERVMIVTETTLCTWSV